MEEMETHPNPFGKPTEMRHSQKTSLAMGEYPQGILANIQKLDIDTFHYQRTADIGRVSVNPESLHQIASQLREPPYAERHVRWCERSENVSYFVSGDIITSMKLPWSRTALRADLMLSELISFTAASYSLS